MSLFEIEQEEALFESMALLEERAALGKLPIDMLQRVVTKAVTIFARSCEQSGYELNPVMADVATTDAVRLSVALARSQNLTPFDLSLWFACTGGVAPDRTEQGE